MFMAEMLVDSVKYLFLSKNNGLKLELYKSKYPKYVSELYLLGYLKDTLDDWIFDGILKKIRSNGESDPVKEIDYMPFRV